MRLFCRQYQSFSGSTNLGTVSELYWMPPHLPHVSYTSGEITQIQLARTIKGVKKRPRFENDTRNGIPRTYCTGAWNLNVVIDEHMRGLKMSIPAPNIKPDMTVVAAAATIVGSFVPYYRYIDGYTGRFGPLSTPGDLKTLAAGQGRSWNNIPQEKDMQDDSVTHIQGLLDDGSGVARVAWTKEVGAPAVYVESVATLSLGQAAPPSFQALPALFRAIAYHDVLVGFGNGLFPERLFISTTGDYEHWEGTYVATNGEPIVGCFATDDVVMYGSFQGIYRTQGFVASDFGRKVEKPDIGFLGPDGFANVNGRIIAPTSVGVMLYDGGWHNLMKDDMADEWQRQMSLYPEEYRDAQGFYDAEEQVYTFGPVPYSPHYSTSDIYDTSDIFSGTSFSSRVFWVLDVQGLFPELQGDFQARWSLDIHPRPEASKAAWTSPSTGTPIIVCGEAATSAADGDGQMRELNWVEDPTDRDETGKRDDGQDKIVWIEPAYFSAQVGGFPDDGARWALGWTFMECGTQNWELYWRAGAENAFRVAPSMALHDTVPASADLEDPGFGADQTERIVLHTSLLTGPNGMSGQVIGQRIKVTNPPDHMRYSGWGVKYLPGVNYRGILRIAGPPV